MKSMKRTGRSRRVLLCEYLESRLALSNALPIASPDFGQVDDPGDYHAVIVAGDPNGTPADFPSDRMDDNTTTSPFAGVASIRINSNRGVFICSGTPFDQIHVLTAGHCIDLSGNGKVDKADGINSVYVNWNTDTDSPTDLVDSQVQATAWKTHPDFTGFARPTVNDDLAVITLGGSGVPAGVPIYDFYGGNSTNPGLTTGTAVTMVGYGRSGDGVSGYYSDASFTIKRRGENTADAFNGQDDKGKTAANEVFFFDFDGPSGNGTYGGPTLGNDKETTLGGGDSGGPSFVLVGSAYQLAGVNTFTQGATAPKFGSLGGGINVGPYVGCILSYFASCGSSSPSGGGSGGGGGGPTSGSTLGAAMDAVLSMAPSEAAVVVQPSSDISGELVASAHAAPSVTPDSLLTEASARESQVVVIVMPQSTVNSDSDPSAAHDAFVAALDVVLEGSTIEDGIGLETTR